MAKPRNKIVDWLEYLLARLGAMILPVIPIPVLYRLARWAGRLAFLVDRKHRRRALEHVRASYDDWDDDQVRRIARQGLESAVLLAVEMMITPRLISPLTFVRHVRFGRIGPLLRQIIAEQSGAIVVTGHFGNWEVPGYTLAVLGMPATVVARPLDNRLVDAYLREIRQRPGLRIVDKKGAAAVVDGILADGGVVCFVADQDAGRRGVFVDFFGRPASTYRSIALLAIRCNVPIFVCYARRLAGGFRFEIDTAGVITPDQWAGVDDEVRWITQTYTRMLESVIRTDPGQYFGWAHRRWKHQPIDAEA